MSLKRKFCILFLFVLAFFISLTVFLKILKNEKFIIELEERKYKSHLLVNKLRQTTDDFSRMAKAYAVTGDSRFKESFFKKLNNYSREISFTKKYHKIYRDFSPNKKSKKSTENNSLEIVKNKVDITKDIALIRKAEIQFKNLLQLENQAINTEPLNQTKAINVLYNQKHHDLKKKIMKFLTEFHDSTNNRIKDDISFHREKNNRLNVVLTIIIILSIFLTLLSVFLVIDSSKQIIKETKKENHSLFKWKIWFRAGWPFMLSSFIIIFIIANLAWWFYLELISIGSYQVRKSTTNSFKNIYNSIIHWVDQTNQEALSLANIINKNIKVNRLHLNFNGTFDEKIKKISFLNFPKFDHYVLTDLDFTIASSNQNHLIGKKFKIPEQIKNQIEKFPYQGIHFPSKQTQVYSSLLSENILFASALGKKEKNGFLFLFVPPQKNLEHFLNHNLFQGSEIYMINSNGEFITKTRWINDLVKRHRLKSEWDSMIGLRVSEKWEDPKAPLTYAANQVLQDEGLSTKTYKNYLGIPVLGFWHWNNNYKFGLISEVSKSERYNIRKFHQFNTFFGVFVTSTLILLLTGFFIRNRIKVAKINAKLNSSYKIIKGQNDKLAQDMLLGQKVQMDMLPYKITDNRFKLDAYLKPAQIVSGDFYDFSFIDNKKRIYFCVGDVSGKGVGAALFMSIAKASMHKILHSQPNMQIKDMVSEVNKELSKNNTNCMFLTLAIGILNPETGSVEMTNAGHVPSYLKKANGDMILLDEVHGPMVGTFEEISFEQQSIKLDKGDTLLLYTDGIIDAQNINEEFYEQDRLEGVLSQQQFSNPKHMIDSIISDVTGFIGKQDQFDDITILSLKYSGKNKMRKS